jgi:hypothetical protein
MELRQMLPEGKLMIGNALRESEVEAAGTTSMVGTLKDGIRLATES